MKPYNHPTMIQDKSKVDMAWLVGRKIASIEKLDFSWFFVFDDGSSIGTESPWRLLSTNGIVASSEDDGHSFGLPAPVNAAERAIEIVLQNHISGFELRERTADLIIYLANNTAIEVLNLSCGYDGWRAVHGKHEVFCLGGGRLAELHAD